MAQAGMPGYESNLGNVLYSGQQEKSFIDKTLARSDVDEIKDIMQKEDLNVQDIRKLLYQLAAIETKLLNFGDFERYLQGKFYAWIRDFAQCQEVIFSIQGDEQKKKIELTDDNKTMLENIRKKMQHNLLFLCDVYLYLGRSTLSLEATAFDTITKNRYEYFYPNQPQGLHQPEAQKRGFFNLNWK
jgi:hypothetical protein